MQNSQKGFTLIEMMMVIAIIAILVAIAIPQFQTYLARSQVTRAVGEAGALKVVVEDCINNGLTEVADGAGHCNPIATGSDILSGASQSAAQTLPSHTGVPQILSPIVTSGETIIATMGNHAAATVAKSTVTWTRDASGSWSCKYSGAAKYAPASCPGS